MVFTLADEIPVFVDTVSEFKAGKIKHWLAHIHTLKPTLPELEILWGQAITSDADRNAAVNALHQQGVQQLFVYLPDESVYCSEKGWRTIFADRASAYDSRQFWC